MKSFASFLAAIALGLAVGNAGAVPNPTTDDITVNRILNLPNSTVRIALDQRTNTLYTVQQNGNLSRIDIQAGTSTQVFSTSDHGVSGVAGFAIGPDGSFYLTDNKRGSSGLGRIAKGVLVDAEAGLRQWSIIGRDDPEAPIADILAAGQAGQALALDPVSGIRYALRSAAEITLIPSGTVASSADHGLNDGAGLFIGPDGTFYLVERLDFTGHNIATVTKGLRDPNTDAVEWFTLAQTEPFEQCDCIFNHQVNGIVVDAANEFIYVNSGSRTDHGEIQTNRNRFPDLRETALTAIILRLPTTARDLTIPNDRSAMRDQSLLYAEGVRNSYDLAFAANGDLFATENSADRDMPEELNWIRQGRHYGFPWRLGNTANPQQFADYDPAADFLLPSSFNAVRNGYYRNDPTFPPAPANMAEPVINLGPDADSYRDPADGQIKDASVEGIVFGTFTSHRSPLGLVFDTDGAVGGPYHRGGFVLSWTEGDPNGDSVAGPFNDASEDLLHLDLEKTADGSNYQARVTRIVGNFENPIDAAIIGNRIYVVEWSGSRGLWEVTLPEAATAVEELASDTTPETAELGQNYPNPFNPQTHIDFSLSTQGPVEMAVFDLAGQKIRTLVQAHMGPGTYRVDWDGRDALGRNVASGVYLYRLETGSFVETRRLTLLK